MSEEAISVRGARVNNLKNISFSIPINQMTVVTGVSGSGKSSLAFDTIYAEGQRRYVESLSAYARQFLERMDKPDVDEVRGIAPAIAIDLIVQWSRRKRIIAAASDAARPWWRSQFVRDFGLAALIGVAFMAVFISVQWNFSKFLISRSADNWFFAGGQFFPYTSGSHGMAWRNQYWDVEENPFTVRAALIAILLAVLFSRIGLGFGNWMAKVRR